MRGERRTQIKHLQGYLHKANSKNVLRSSIH
jgi:hypothetical protein